MTLKQKNYQIIKKFYKLVNSEKKSITLIVHISDLNITQYNILKNFCQKNEIKNTYVKINLLKKLTKNELFLNLFAGPTQIFFFKDLNSLILFEKQILKDGKFIPLAIIYNNEIFSYPFFKMKIKSYQNLGLLSAEEIQNKFILNLKSSNLNFIKILPYKLNNFIYSLSQFKKTKNT